MRPEDLRPALESAAEAAERGGRFEAFARRGETQTWRRDPAGDWERRWVQETGVAVRVSGRGGTGFASAAGSGGRAGRAAALGALACRRPGADPLPPRAAFEGPPLPIESAIPGEGLEEFARAWHAALAALAGEMRIVQVRAFAGAAVSAWLTAEGARAHAVARGAVGEAWLAPAAGPWRHLRFAATCPAELDPEKLAVRAVETVVAMQEGSAAPRGLADVVLAPDVAAALVALLASSLTAAARDSFPRGRVSPLWRLVDERRGPGGVAPQAVDGEGLPARTIVLVDGGRLGEPLATWLDAARYGVRAGGAVRPSFRQPPAAGPANLVVQSASPTARPDMLATLGRGYLLTLPAGPPEADAGGRFTLRCAARHVQDGRLSAIHPLVEVRGSLRRLLSGLAAVGDDREAFSLDCAVTTPSILVRQLEIA